MFGFKKKEIKSNFYFYIETARREYKELEELSLEKATNNAELSMFKMLISIKRNNCIKSYNMAFMCSLMFFAKTNNFSEHIFNPFYSSHFADWNQFMQMGQALNKNPIDDLVERFERAR